jgi:penicillin-binding protein 1C
VILILALTTVLFLVSLLPVRLFDDPVSTVLVDRNGVLLAARVAADGQWRFPQGPVPEKLKKATLAFEDRYFYFHPGVNPVSLIRALAANIRERRIVRGGSTLTMQTIRLSRKGSRTVKEKLLEIAHALWLERHAGKNEILALYLSHAPYGGNVVGAETASWRYFGTTADNLSWGEAATLAVLPNSPSLIHPGRNRQMLRQKRNRLLGRMRSIGWIDSVTWQTAVQEKLPDEPFRMPRLAPHLLGRMANEAPGNLIHSTIDAGLQEKAIHIVNRYHKNLEYNQIHNIAALIIEVNTGNVLVYIGNSEATAGEVHGNEVDLVRATRSTGSVLKPILYAAMLDDGKILPQSLVPDIPVNLSGFAPQNFNGQYEGAVPADHALSRSLNVPAVEMLREYGTERFLQLLRSMGIRTLNRTADHYGLSLILGGAEASLEDMTNLYAGLSRELNRFAKEGRYDEGDIRPVNLVAGQILQQGKGREEAEWLSAAAVWFAYRAMNEVGRPDEEAGWRAFASSGRIAWKTGTSFGYRDGWAIGTSPRYVVGVWAGNADGEGRPGLTGIATAAPVMFALFGILPSSPWFEKPAEELVPAAVCHESGYLAGPLCPDTDTIAIPVTGVRSPACPYHRTVHLSSDGRYRVNSNCCSVDSMIHPAWFILPPVQEWYYVRHHPEYRVLPPFRADCIPEQAGSMGLVYPRSDTRIFVPVELGGNQGRVIFEAVHRDPGGTIYWHLDGKYLATTRHIHQVELFPSPGKHILVLIDQRGEELIRSFTVEGKSRR